MGKSAIPDTKCLQSRHCYYVNVEQPKVFFERATKIA